MALTARSRSSPIDVGIVLSGGMIAAVAWALKRVGSEFHPKRSAVATSLSLPISGPSGANTVLQELVKL